MRRGLVQAMATFGASDAPAGRATGSGLALAAHALIAEPVGTHAAATRI
jgi:hypothetical protein